MTAGAYVLTVPAVAPSFNEWKAWHWTKQERARKAWQELVWPLLHEKGNTCPRPLQTPVRLRAVVVCPTNRRRDRDNFGALLWKWTQDLLVIRGFLPDDSAELVEAFPPGIVVAAGESRTIVTIEWEEA
jgi:hypothetical protein